MVDETRKRKLKTPPTHRPQNRYQELKHTLYDLILEEQKWWAEYRSIYKGYSDCFPSKYYMIKGMYTSSRKAKEAAKQQLNKKESSNPNIDHIRIKSIFDQEKVKEKHMKYSDITH